MIRLAAGDLVALERDAVFYYALILDRIRLFGANWAYVFHVTSKHPLAASDVLNSEGFNAFVDFIHAKRQGRIQKLARGLDVQPYWGPGFLKRTFANKGKAREWFISDMSFKQVKRTAALTLEERAYPLNQASSEMWMIRRVEEKWSPAADERI